MNRDTQPDEPKAHRGKTSASGQRTRTRQTLKAKGQVTVPKQVREALHVTEGDDVEFTVDEDGTVTVRGLKSIPADQAWYWTEEWQAGEREADEQIAAGEGRVLYSAEEFLASLDQD